MTHLTRQWERGLQVKYTVGVVRPRRVFADLVNFLLFKKNLSMGFYDLTENVGAFTDTVQL